MSSSLRRTCFTITPSNSSHNSNKSSSTAIPIRQRNDDHRITHHRSLPTALRSHTHHTNKHVHFGRVTVISLPSDHNDRRDEGRSSSRSRQPRRDSIDSDFPSGHHHHRRQPSQERGPGRPTPPPPPPTIYPRYSYTGKQHYAPTTKAMMAEPPDVRHFRYVSLHGPAQHVEVVSSRR